MSELSKLPPQALDLEEAVLGAIMLERDALAIVADTLTPETFYKTAHQEIYQSCLNLFTKGEAIDMLTVTNELRSRNALTKAGGVYAVTELCRGVNSTAHLEQHSRIIYQMAVKRNLIALSRTISDEGYKDTTDALSLADTALKLIYDAVGNMGTNLEILSPIVNRLYKKLVIPRKNNELSGIPTMLTKLNSLTGGWQQPDLIIIAARPGMGKTACVLNAILESAEAGYPCAMFSLEMSKEQLTKRMIAIKSSICIQDIMRNDIKEYELERMSQGVGKLEKLPIHIDDTAGLTIVQFRSVARRLVQNEGVKLIVIDYLQLMHGEASTKNRMSNREQEISAITRAIKVTAKELQVPIIALSQLSRGVESRNDKRPQLSDLRESGSIEQDADLVMFLYRPEYYGITEDENGLPTLGLCEVILAKHRNGDVGMIPAKFIGKFQSFKDYDNDTNWGDTNETVNKFEASAPF